LRIETKDGVVIPAFSKTRTSNTAESFFLILFGVYQNEVLFYQFLQTPEGKRVIKLLPEGFFPKAYVAKFSPFGTNFDLILENVSKSRSSESVGVSFPALSPRETYLLNRLRAVLRAQATLHATFSTNGNAHAPETVWGGS